MNHEQVNVIAFRTHYLCQVYGSEENEGIETEEIALERTVVDIEETDGQREEYDKADTLYKSRAYGLIAHCALYFQFQIFANLTEAVKSLELRDVLELGLFFFADFIIKRFRKGGRIIDKTTAKTLISHADSVTGDVQELCEAIWETTDDDATISADDIPTSLELIFSREGEAYGAAIRSLTATQVSLLRALAATKLPRVFSEAFKESARITNTATIQKSLKRLAMKRLIYEYGGQYRFTNPFFREWLLQKM